MKCYNLVSPLAKMQIPKARRPALFSQLVFISQLLKLVPINNPPSEMKRNQAHLRMAITRPYLRTIDAPLSRYAPPTKADDCVNLHMPVNKLPRLQDLAEAVYYFSVVNSVVNSVVKRSFRGGTFLVSVVNITTARLNRSIHRIWTR